MKQITDIEELAGKTISSAKLSSFDDSLILAFSNGAYAYFDIVFYDDTVSIEMDREPDDFLKVKAGILTEEEYNSIENEKEAAMLKRREQNEINMLKLLKEKYGE